jgi:hypothetical protein
MRNPLVKESSAVGRIGRWFFLLKIRVEGQIRSCIFLKNCIDIYRINPEKMEKETAFLFFSDENVKKQFAEPE